MSSTPLQQTQRLLERASDRQGHEIGPWAHKKDKRDPSGSWVSACRKCGQYVRVNLYGDIVAGNLDFNCPGR